MFLTVFGLIRETGVCLGCVSF